MSGESVAPRTWGTAMTRERALDMRDPLVCAFAPVAGGKTSFLVEKAASLVTCGETAPRLLVAVNTAEQVRAFCDRLAAVGVDYAGVHVDVPYRVLADALGALGQCPRVLTRAEFNIVIEDLKHAGIAPGDIKAMLQEMRCSLARACPMERDGLDGRVAHAYQALRDRLFDMGATLREELPVCVLDAGAASDIPQYDYVLVDDAQNLSVATLRALAGMGSRQALIVGNPLQALPGFDPGFELAAFCAFAQAESANCVRLEPVGNGAPAIAAFGQALCDRGFEDSPFWVAPAQTDEVSRTAVLHIKWREPKNEIEGICRIVGNLLDADPDLLPRNVCIAVPNRMWANAFEAELGRRRLAYQTLLDDDPVAGDPRSTERLGTLGAYALLGLAANIDDACAWRFWFALGREDFGCGLWQAFRAYCTSHDQSCGGAARALADYAGGSATAPADLANPAEQADKVDSANLREAAASIAEAFDRLRLMEGKRGFTLRNHLCRVYPSAQVSRVFEYFDGVEGAQELFEALQGLSFCPSFADRPSQVCIASYRAASTLSPLHLFVPGMAEGMVGQGLHRATDQPDAQERANAAQRRALGCAAACARESLTTSSFQRSDIELARRDKLPARFTRKYQGREMAVFTKSPFFDDVGDAMSGSVSGEQFFIDEQERRK